MLLARLTSTVSVPDSSAAQVDAITYTIPANAIRVGSVYRLHVGGICTTNIGGVVNMVFRLVIGGSTVCSQSVAHAAVSAKSWSIYGTLTCTAVGAGTTTVYGDILGHDEAGNAAADQDIKSANTLGSLDSTATLNCKMTLAWASAAALGDTYTIQNAWTERLN